LGQTLLLIFLTYFNAALKAVSNFLM
jgi:hypothetical protein